MSVPKDQLSRRTFLKAMQLAPALLLPAPLRILGWPLDSSMRSSLARDFLFSDLRITPHYPASNPLDEVLRQVVPGGDEYLTEKYAFEILAVLGEWSKALKMPAPGLGSVVGKFIDPGLKATAVAAFEQTAVRTKYGIDVWHRKFAAELVS